MSEASSSHSQLWKLQPMVRNSIIGLIFFCLVCVVHSCATDRNWLFLPENQNSEKVVHIVNHGWHTGIIIAKEDLGEHLDFLDKKFKHSRYFEFGWGDRDFYQAEGKGFWLGAKAIFWPTDSVMHVVGFSLHPRKYFNPTSVTSVKLSQHSLHLIQNQIAASFFRETEPPQVLKVGLYGHSYFYPAVGTFYFANTCNHWMAEILQGGGLPISTFMTVTASQVMNEVEEANSSYSCCKK